MFNKLTGRKFFLTKKVQEYDYPENIRIIIENSHSELLVVLDEDTNKRLTLTRKELFSYYCGIRPHFVMCCRTVRNIKVRRNVIITLNTFIDENSTKEEIRDIHVMYYHMFENNIMELDYNKDMREEGFDENGVVNLVNERLYKQPNTTTVRSYHLCYGYITDTMDDLLTILPIKKYLNTYKQLCMWNKRSYNPLVNYFELYSTQVTKRKYVEEDSRYLIRKLENGIHLNSLDYVDPNTKILLSTILYYNFNNIDDIDLRTLKIAECNLSVRYNMWKIAYPKHNVTIVLFKDKKCYVFLFKEKPVEYRIHREDSPISEEEWSIFKSRSK